MEEINEIFSEMTMETIRKELIEYGSLDERSRPLIVSGILLALTDITFSVSDLDGVADGQKIYDAIQKVLTKLQKPELIPQFKLFISNDIINRKRGEKTPLRIFAERIRDTMYESIKDNPYDMLGNLYSGNDGQTLGIVLTPFHITELVCKLLAVKKDDIVLEPCCGTGSFLTTVMSHMCAEADNDSEIEHIITEQVRGIELQDYMYTIAATNMILRGNPDGVRQGDFLAQDPAQLKADIKATVGFINPPYSQGSKNRPELYEINFIKHLLDSVLPGGRVAAIVPQSTMTAKTISEKQTKKAILENHTLEGVITLNKKTFPGVGVHPCLAIFTAGVKHSRHKKVKFINFEDDGRDYK